MLNVSKITTLTETATPRFASFIRCNMQISVSVVTTHNCTKKKTVHF